MTLVPTIAGIAWDPQIRGILAVAVGVAVLMGSVYLVLATNLAGRLGLLVILAAIFGWLTIHSMLWWLYPPSNGPSGRVPSWDVEEINYGDLSQALLTKAHDLDMTGLPATKQVDDATPAQIDKINAEQRGRLKEWKLLSGSAASRAEAQTTADALLSTGVIQGLESTDSYVHRYVLETGGKPVRKSNSTWDRVTNTITDTVRIKSPPHYAIVEIQPAIHQEAVPGQKPPVPKADSKAQVINIVMVRDLGQRRLPAALTCMGSGLIFALLCVMLHQRDRVAAEHRSAPVPATTGG